MLTCNLKYLTSTHEWETCLRCFLCDHPTRNLPTLTEKSRPTRADTFPFSSLLSVGARSLRFPPADALLTLRFPKAACHDARAITPLRSRSYSWSGCARMAPCMDQLRQQVGEEQTMRLMMELGLEQLGPGGEAMRLLPPSCLPRKLSCMPTVALLLGAALPHLSASVPLCVLACRHLGVHQAVKGSQG